MNAELEKSVFQKIERVKQVILDLDQNIHEKYQVYYPSFEVSDHQKIDNDYNVEPIVQRISRLEYEDTFLRDVHNLLDAYNLCGCSVSEQIDKIGLKQISLFLKSFILSSRKTMILALNIICSYYKIPKVIDEKRFKISTQDVELEVNKENNEKKYNQKKVKHQKGTVDKDLIYLIKNDLYDKPELVPESIKKRLGQIFDPLLQEFREAHQMMDEALRNKDKYLSMQPSNVGFHMSNTIKDINGTANEVYEFQQHNSKSNQKREEMNLLANKFCSDMIMDELQQEIKGNFEDSARKRMQNVILQVIEFLKRKTAEQHPQIGCQTDLRYEDIERQIEEAEKEARMYKWELEATKGNIRTLSLQNEELQKDLDLRNKKIQELNLKIIDQLSQIEKLQTDIKLQQIQYEQKLKLQMSEMEKKLRLLGAQKNADLKEQSTQINISTKQLQDNSTQTIKIIIGEGKDNHIYASQRNYSLFKRRYSHDLQLEGRVHYFYKLKKIKDELDRNPKKRKRLNIPQDINFRTENRAAKRLEKQLQVLQQIKEHEKDIINMRYQQNEQQGSSGQISYNQYPQSISPLLPQNKKSMIRTSLAYNHITNNINKKKEDFTIQGSSQKTIIPQHHLDHIYKQYQSSKALIQKATEQSIQSIPSEFNDSSSITITQTDDYITKKTDTIQENLSNPIMYNPLLKPYIFSSSSNQQNLQMNTLNSLQYASNQKIKTEQSDDRNSQTNQIKLEQNNENSVSQDLQKRIVFKFIDELKKSQGGLFKNFTVEQIKEIEQYIIFKELGVQSNSQNNLQGINVQQQYNPQNDILPIPINQNESIWNDIMRQKLFQDLITLLYQIESESERCYVLELLYNYLSKLIRRSRKRINNTSHPYKLSPDSYILKYHNFSPDTYFSPESHSQSPEQLRSKKIVKERIKSEQVKEQSDRKDGFIPYKQFQDKQRTNILNHRTRQRSCNSFNTVLYNYDRIKNSSDAIFKNNEIDRLITEQRLRSQYETNQSLKKTTVEEQNEHTQQEGNQSSEKKIKFRVKRQNSLDRCDNVNLPALNIIKKAQEHMQQFQQSVTLQNYKKIHNQILIHQKLKQKEDAAKLQEGQLKFKSLNKSQIGQSNQSQLQQNLISEPDSIDNELKEESLQQLFLTITQNHELMLECLQIFQNSSIQNNQQPLTHEQTSLLQKQSKYPFFSVQQYRSGSLLSNANQRSFSIWKDRFCNLSIQLQQDIIKKIKQIN